MPESGPASSTARDGSAPALALAGVSAVLASTCCVVPLLFALAGLSGAWLGRLRWLEPYSTALIGVALVSLGVAGLRLYRSDRVGEACASGGDAACGRANASARRVFWVVAALTLIPIVVPLAAPLFYQEIP